MKKHFIFILIVSLLLASPFFFTESSFVENKTTAGAFDDTQTVAYDVASQTERKDDATAISIPADAESGDAVKTQLVVSYSDDSLETDEHFISSTGDFYLLEYDTEEEAAAAEAQFEEDEKADDVENPVVMTIMETDSSSLAAESSENRMDDTTTDLYSDVDFGTSLTVASTYLSYGPEAIFADTFADDLLTKYTSVENMPEIVVGIVDTGIDSDHSFLFDRILDYSYTCVTGTADAEDDNGHGTHVAGIIVDTTLDNVKLKAYKVANAEGKGNDYTIAWGINAAVADGVDVINVSMGGEIPSGYTATVLKAAVANATAAGVLVCVAAGNDNADADTYMPASFTGAFTVAAVNNNSTKASFSNYGDCVDIAAPGVSINSSWSDGSYQMESGTSMATPFVAAAAALLLSSDPTESVTEIKYLLSDYATDAGTTGWDEFYGNGVLNLSDIGAEDCLLSFDANGGSEVSEVLTVHAGDVCPTLPTTTQYGKDFLGWYDTDGNLISAGDIINVVGSMKLTAGWSTDTYSVTLDANGGSCSPTSITATFATSYQDLPTPSRIGYSFDGWYTSTGTEIQNADILTFPWDITLTARWSANTYIVTLDAKGGNCTPASITVTYDGTYCDLPTPSRIGYSFNGWYTSTGNKIVSSTAVSITSDITLTARWTVSDYTITVSSGENGNISPSTSSVSYDSSKTFTIIPDSGYRIECVTVDGVNVGAVSSYTFSNVRANHTISAIFSQDIFFNDVCSSAWYFDSVQKAVTWGLFNGTSSTKFSPDSVMTRAMFVTVLYRYEGSPVVSGTMAFSDLAHDYYYDAVLWAFQNGIVSGTSATTFSPNVAVNRQQMVVFLYRYCCNYKEYDVSFLADLSGYSDTNKIDSYAVTAMKWAVAEGYISGTSQTTLSPQTLATRAQVAKFLVNFVDSL
jgi:uncharacterized repeat protein (TIGR02543 family)